MVMSHFVAGGNGRNRKRWVSWNGTDIVSGVFGWLVTILLVHHQLSSFLISYGLDKTMLYEPKLWSLDFILAVFIQLLPVAAIVTILALIGLELGIPTWAPWRLFQARRTLILQDSPPAIVHGTGFWPVYFERVYTREQISRVLLEVESGEQHLRNERYADFARLALFRSKHRLPKILMS